MPSAKPRGWWTRWFERVWPTRFDASHPHYWAAFQLSGDPSWGSTESASWLLEPRYKARGSRLDDLEVLAYRHRGRVTDVAAFEERLHLLRPERDPEEQTHDLERRALRYSEDVRDLFVAKFAPESKGQDETLPFG